MSELKKSSNFSGTCSKAGSPQITGIVERQRKTMLNAFRRIAFRKKIHATIGEQRKDLDVWMKGEQSRV